ncbi:MAG TPA: hypothetical protein VGC92_12970, partial [Phenylobacterium sp.]
MPILHSEVCARDVSRVQRGSMLLWILLLGGLALAAAAVGLFLAMGRAERRARRTLFRALGLPDETVDLL